MLWLGIAGLLVLALAFLLWPWLRRGPAADSRKAHDLAVYRAQLAEVDQDVARGNLTAAEAAAARLEVQRRLLRADAAPEQAGSAVLNPAALLVTAVLLGLLPVGAVGLYMVLGLPQGADPARLVARAAPPAAQPESAEEDQEMAVLVGRLRQRLEQTPNDVNGWLLLARTQMSRGVYAEAVDAYNRAVALNPGDADLHASRGEAMLFANDGNMTPAAQAAFLAALERDPGHPGAKYYLAHGKLQAGDARGAFQDWLTLARGAPPDAPWLPLVRERLAELAPQMGADLAKLLPPARPALPPLAPTLDPRGAQPGVPPGAAPPVAQGQPGPTREQMEAAQSMSAGDRAAMIRSMVDRLAERLKEQPNDAEGWIRLGRAREVLNEPALAREAWAKAAALLPEGTPARREADSRVQALSGR